MGAVKLFFQYLILSLSYSCFPHLDDLGSIIWWIGYIIWWTGYIPKSIREGLKKIKKVILITFGSDPPPLKVIISFSATRPIFENFWKKVYFSPWKSPKHLEKFSKKGKNKSWASRCQPHRAKCRPTAQNVGRTAQNVGRTRVMSAATRLMFVKDQRGGFMCPPGPKGPPLYKKTLVSRNDF